MRNKQNPVSQRIEWLRSNPGLDLYERKGREREIKILQLLEKKVDKDIEAKEAAAEAAKRPADPKVADAMEHSRSVFLDLKYHTGVTTRKDVEDAENRGRVAARDPELYWTLYHDWNKDWKERTDAAARVHLDAADAERAKGLAIAASVREIEKRAAEEAARKVI
jgi:hypothetical protein